MDRQPYQYQHPVFLVCPSCTTPLIPNATSCRVCKVTLYYPKPQFPKEDTLFFPDHTGENVEKIIRHLKAARKSISVCVYTITNKRLCQALADIKRRSPNMDIILITDGEQADKFKITRVLLSLLERAGILITKIYPTMHHKFVIIDNNLLMNGSYNWTEKATNNNRENLDITSNQEKINSYLREFSELLKQNKPRKRDLGGYGYNDFEDIDDDLYDDFDLDFDELSTPYSDGMDSPNTPYSDYGGHEYSESEYSGGYTPASNYSDDYSDHY